MNVWDTNSEWWQIFRYSQEMFVNVKGKVVTIEKDKDAEGAMIGIGDKVNGDN